MKKGMTKLVIFFAFITSIIFIISGVLFSLEKLTTFGFISAGYPVGLFIGTYFIKQRGKYRFIYSYRDLFLFLLFLSLNYLLFFYGKFNNKPLFVTLLITNVVLGILIFFRLFFQKEK